MSRDELLASLEEQGLEVFVANGRLRYRGESAPSGDLLARMRDHRAELLDSLETSGLSHGQAALWFLWKLDPKQIAYNTAFAVRVAENLDASLVERAVTELCTRHSALRSTFSEEHGRPRRYARSWPEPTGVTDASGWSQADVETSLAELADRPFDLEKGPVARFQLFVNAGAPGRQVLLFAAHHIVVDFRSLEIIVRDFNELCSVELEQRSASLPPLTCTWRDHVEEEQAWLESSEGRSSAQWWRTRLSGELPPLELPADFPRPAEQQFAGGTRVFELGSEMTRRVRVFANANAVTPYVVLLSAFALLLSRYTGRRNSRSVRPCWGGAVSDGGRSSATWSIRWYFDCLWMIAKHSSVSFNMSSLQYWTRWTIRNIRFLCSWKI